MITVTDEQVKKAEEMLKHIPNGVPKAMARAINRSIASAKTTAVTGAVRQYAITREKVNEAIYPLRKATAANLHASIYARGRARRLINFNVTPNQFPESRPKERPLAAVFRKEAQERMDYSFIAKVRGDHVGIFTKNSSGKLEQLYGPSVPQMLSEKGVMKAVEDKAAQLVPVNLDKEIDRLLRGR